MTHRTSPSAPASTLPHDATSALTQEQLSHLLQQVAPRPGQWRDEDYLRLTDCTSRRIELTDGHVTLTVLALRGEGYVEHGVFPRGERAVSASFDGLTADVGAVFDAAA